MNFCNQYAPLPEGLQFFRFMQIYGSYNSTANMIYLIINHINFEFEFKTIKDHTLKTKTQ